MLRKVDVAIHVPLHQGGSSSSATRHCVAKRPGARCRYRVRKSTALEGAASACVGRNANAASKRFASRRLSFAQLHIEHGRPRRRVVVVGNPKEINKIRIGKLVQPSEGDRNRGFTSMIHVYLYSIIIKQ